MSRTRSMRLLPERYQVVTATVGRAAGEGGTLYQAANFHSVGSKLPRRGLQCADCGAGLGVIGDPHVMTHRGA